MAAGGGPDRSPDKNGDQTDQHDTDPAPFAEDIPQLGPIDAEGPESDPGEQGNPREEQEPQADNDILQCKKQVSQGGDQIRHVILKPKRGEQLQARRT